MSDLKNKLSHLIEGQIPDYLRDSYPQFATFIKKYYEFLEQSHEANYLLLNSDKWSDVDLTLDMFVEKMREQHAYDISTNALLERKRLIKFINQYYEAKGSENAAELFFRMMYNDNASVKYPGDYVLRASDGKWIVKKTVKIDTDYLQINPVSFNLKPAATAQSASLSLFNLKDKQIYLKYNTIDNDGLQTFSIPILCLTVAQVVNNSDIYELQIDLARGTSVEDLNKLLSTIPYMETVWVTAFHDGVEYTYGFLSQQLIGYNILEGGENFRRRDTFEVEVSESLLYPIPGQEVNNGLVRVNSITNRDYGQFFAEDYAPLYGISDTQGIINGLSFLNTGYRFDITGDYFAEAFTEADDYTTYKTFERTLVNPRGSTDALVEFDVGYIYQRPGMWMDNSGFLSDINKLQDNYYYQAFSYVIQTTAIPYHKWESLYKLSAHPAGFKVFGELLVEHAISFTPIDIESATFYTEMFIDGVFPIDEIVIDFYKVSDETVHVWNSYAPYYFGEEYTPGDDFSWSLVKPIDNTVISDDTDYNFHVEKNLSGISVIDLNDTVEKDINVLYTDESDAEDVFDRVVDYNREFTEVEIVADTHIFDASKSLSDDDVVIDVFDRVVDYNREFTEVKDIDDSVSKDVSKSVIENNGYNTTGYFSEEYAQIIGVITTETVLTEVTRLVDVFDTININDELSLFNNIVVDAETVNIDDLVYQDTTKNVTETIITSETIERNIQQNDDAQSDLADDLNTLDVKIVTFDSLKTDSFIVSDESYNLISKPAEDFIIQTDVSYLDYEKNSNETLNTTETLARVIGKPLGDTVNKVDSIEVMLGRDLLDGISSTEFSTIFVDKLAIDNVFQTDSNSKHLNKVVDGAQYTAEIYFSELYNYDVSENVVELSDTLAAHVGKEFTDLINGITDSNTFTLNQLLTDAVILSDGIFYNKLENDDAQSDLSEQIGFTDTKSFVLLSNKTDTVQSVDQPSKHTTKPLSDNVVESDSTVMSFGKQLSELENVIDTAIFTINKNSSDTIISSDSDIFQVDKILTDAVIETDFVSRAVSKSSADDVDVVDSLAKNTSTTKTDSVTQIDSNAKHINKPIDGTYYNEQGYFNETYVYDTSENVIEITDNTSIHYLDAVSDTISNISDSKILTLNHVFSDEVITETNMHHHHLQNNDELSDLDDNNHVTDQLSVSLNISKIDSTVSTDLAAKHVSRPLTDTFTKSDVITTKSVGKNSSDNILTSETITKNISDNLSDTFTKSDTLSRNLTKLLTDTGTLSDNLTSVLFRQVNLSDTFTKTDSISKNISDNLADTFTKSDSIVKNISDNLADTFTKSDSIVKNISDNLADTAITSETIVKNISDNLADTFTKSDSIAKNINSGTKTETISSADSNAKHINKPIDGAYYNEQGYFSEEYVYDITQNLVDASDSMTLVNEGYAGTGYVSDGYATETRTV